MKRRDSLKSLAALGALALPGRPPDPIAFSPMMNLPDPAADELPPDSDLDTLAVHAGSAGDPATGAVTPPLYLSTTYGRHANGTFGPYNYTRGGNPTRHALEIRLAALEGGADAFAFASGMAAALAVFQAVLAPGAHVVLPDDCHHGTRALLDEVLTRWQVTYSEVDMSDPVRVAAVLRPETALVWLETPSNPQLKIADIKAIVGVAKARGVLVGCDNTWATPYFQRPLALGVDVVMHSTTKYLGGHSDLLGGCVVVGPASPLAERLRLGQKYGGAAPAPCDCWLLLRSLATFPLRMPRHAASAGRLARWLEAHPRIERVFYPGLPAHPHHAVAKRQMRGGFGGMLAVLVRGGAAEALRVAGSLRLFRHATSLGGVESLVEHRRSAEGTHPKSAANLLRVSVGIERCADLLADWQQALAGPPADASPGK